MKKSLPKFHHRAVFYTETDDSPYPEEKGVGFTKCLHKRPHSESRYLLPNEVICAGLGRIIGLPVPSWEVTISEDGTHWFSSLHFNFDDDELPDVDPQAFWDARPRWMTAVVVFDVFIANADRHDKNIAVDDPLKPKLFKVFDHDQALLGGLTYKPSGVARLDDVANKIGLTYQTGGLRNDFIDEMTSSEYMLKWTKRIKDIPDWMIQNCVDAGSCYGLTEQESQSVAEFLKTRRHKLADLILADREQFPRIAEMRIGDKIL